MKTKLPDGWKEIELGEILEYEQPTNYIVENENYDDQYKTPVLTAGKSFILGYTDEKEGIYTKLPVIIFDDFTISSKYVTFPFKVKSSAMKLLTPKTKNVNLKYIFWLMQTIKVNSVSHKRYYISKYQHIKIPLPPISVQNKIVSILEKTEKAKEMRKEADELTNDFLKAVFFEMFGDKNKFETKKLKEIGQLKHGFLYRPTDYVKQGIITIRIGDFDEEDVYITENVKVDSSNLEKHKEEIIRKGDVIIALSGATTGKSCLVKKDIVALQNYRVGRIITDKKIILPEYIAYFIKTNYFQTLIKNSSVVSAQPNISKENFDNFNIPLPPIELQNKFASIVKEVEQIKEQQKHSKKQIDNLFNALMQKAFKGGLIT